ncbi:hypothetical protein A0H76_1442 [Hepatospora eriocheir]|uniref:Uncharacterized protein n=1 Tax=Hepatospora eriocheir TaxID=1081669 RepID=A0A1X0QH21_9MICR|nr:hypothetical protein A0H76_1442 [Hepatospora eriocheir]
MYVSFYSLIRNNKPKVINFILDKFTFIEVNFEIMILKSFEYNFAMLNVIVYVFTMYSDVV